MCNENSLQPRTVITIIAADDNGFHATVTYEGEPEYPEFKEQREPSPGKPSNRYRASNRVQQTGTKCVSPAPPPTTSDSTTSTSPDISSDTFIE